MSEKLNEVNTKPNKFGRYMAIKHVERLLQNRNKCIAKLETENMDLKNDYRDLQEMTQRLIDGINQLNLGSPILKEKIKGLVNDLTSDDWQWTENEKSGDEND